MKRLFPVLLVLAAAGSAAAQQPATTVTPARRPLAYLSGTLALQPIADERLLAARARLEVPAGAHTRPWVSVGAWAVPSTGAARPSC